MRFTSHYIIRPTAELLGKLSNSDIEIVETLNQPVLWSKKEGGKTNWQPSEYVEQVKIAFLLNLFKSYSDSKIEIFLNKIFQKGNLDLNVFDEFWEVERFEDIDETFEDIESQLDIDSVSRLKNLDSQLVKAWLSYLLPNYEKFKTPNIIENAA
jgi:hypothetical protein